MNLDFIARLLDLVERSKVSELELTEGENRIRIVKRANSRAGAPSIAGLQTVDTPAARPSEPTDPSAAPGKLASATRHEIRAGFPGTFFRAPAPDRPPYAEVGSMVEEGRQLAILEAMKTMNPVEADVAGALREILAEDGAAVEAGALLFVIETDA
ncbi:MAG: acetyl-CoA carboxylase biotin carboxyl carrier protein [Methylobacterium mesophilicum]|nr:acetyl-CoA carboxylase biotin carboxyl carrier protein [Methylobacterium mesophilicum]